MAKEKEFIIPVEWSVFGYVKAKGTTLKDAVQYANEHLNDFHLPVHCEYVEDSFRISYLDEYRKGPGAYDYEAAATDEYEIYQDGSFDRYAG